MKQLKRIKSLLVTLATLVLTLSALINSASACGAFHYQPKLPQALRK
ncbi:cyclic lactone autoinducer peptide [Desulfotomaculum nigrificans]|nr:cyclic lactone autoinducer peptide [Desulfotomaculum nigrificans]